MLSMDGCSQDPVRSSFSFFFSFFSFWSEKQLPAEHTVLVDEGQKRAVVIDVAISADSNIRKRERGNAEEIPGLRRQVEQMWRVKAKVSPEVIEALGAVTPELQLQNVPGKTSEVSDQKDLSPAVQETAKLLCRSRVMAKNEAMESEEKYGLANGPFMLFSSFFPALCSFIHTFHV